MEEILQDILKNRNVKQEKSYEEIDDNQSRIIESELKKLGYIN
jgi:predicted HAD superfamily phosphohydrolase